MLDQMVSATTSISWTTDNGHMLGYKLREAMLVAKNKKITPYDKLRDKFIIRNKGDKVMAELRVYTAISLQESLSRVTIEDISVLPAIIGAAITHKANEMYFPDARLSYDDTEKLYLWASKNFYFLIISESGVTLTKNDPGEARWEPEPDDAPTWDRV